MTWDDVQGKIVWLMIAAMVSGLFYTTKMLYSLPDRTEIEYMLNKERNVMDKERLERRENERRIIDTLNRLSEDVARIKGILQMRTSLKKDELSP